VLARGEKGTAKTTMVRALAQILPGQQVVPGCRFGCDPLDTDPGCLDGPHDGSHATRPARLVELPVGATEDRVVGSLDLRRALGAGEAAFEPGLLATAHRGILYVDEVNLLADHLVDVLLDAAAMGRNTVERDGVSVSHPARIVLVGTMNPEEGELRPQLLDRFGLTVEIAASRDPVERAEVVRRRLAFDADPAGFVNRFAADQARLTARIAGARAALPSVRLTDDALTRIARVCAGFDVDGMRADIVTARAARAHAAWHGRDLVTRADIRAAARLALPHRRRRNPFDAPGLDEELLEELLGDEPDDPPTDDPPPDDPPSDDPPPDDPPSDDPSPTALDDPPRDQSVDRRRDPSPVTDRHQPRTDPAPERDRGDRPEPPGDADSPGDAVVPVGVAEPAAAYRTRRFTVRGVGGGQAGRRSRALTTAGRVVAARRDGSGPVHLRATIAAAAPHQARRTGTRAATGSTMRFTPDDLRTAVLAGREANLVLFAVDASGSMAAHRRMEEVKTAVLSLLLDAYQRRDRVGLVTFRGGEAALTLPPTSSVEAAARCLRVLPHGGRTPLAEGLVEAARVVVRERIRDPRRRALVLLVTDGRATGGTDALTRARAIADGWPGLGVDAVVVDCETGQFRMGLAADLARRMGAEHVAVGEVAAGRLVDVVGTARATMAGAPQRRGVA
jgi:magnesium chelatase subunit D